MSLETSGLNRGPFTHMMRGALATAGGVGRRAFLFWKLPACRSR